MKTPIAKPTTMLIKHNPASLKSNNVFLPLDKPKITTKIERLDEIRKLWNEYDNITLFIKYSYDLSIYRAKISGVPFLKNIIYIYINNVPTVIILGIFGRYKHKYFVNFFFL